MATVITSPALAAASYAAATTSQGWPAGFPHTAPVSSAPVSASDPQDKLTMSIPSCNASLTARIMTSSVGPSLTPGDPASL